jgi:hypothetical protein
MIRLAAHGLDVGVPDGFEGRVTRRRATAHGERARPVVHLATVPLPEARGDFGGNVVELLRSDDVFVVLFDYGPESAAQPLFATGRLPRRLAASDFSPARLQRGIPGQTACQRFFSEAGRAFCLYVVVGDRRAIARALGHVNRALAEIRISPA